MNQLTAIYVAIVVSTIVGHAQASHKMRGDVYTRSGPVGDIRVGMTVHCSDMAILADSNQETNTVQELVSLTLEKIGRVEMYKETGEKVPSRNPETVSQDGYPGVVGGERAQLSDKKTLRPVRWTFPKDRRSHHFLKVGGPGRVLPLSTFFEVHEPGTYKLKYWPKFYAREQRSGTPIEGVNPYIPSFPG